MSLKNFLIKFWKKWQRPSLLSQSEINNLKKFYPNLKLKRSHNKEFLRGKLKVDAIYNDQPIKDAYEIEIELTSDYPHSLPLVREVGGRIEKILVQKNIRDKRKLHINPEDNTICFCAKPEERLRFSKSVNIINFIRELVIPYFYGLSYGRWPWGEYGHGDMGIFEFYVEHSNLKNRAIIEDCIRALSEQSKLILRKKGKVKGHLNCICGSGRAIRKCHPVVLMGLRLLKQDINIFSIDI